MRCKSCIRESWFKACIDESCFRYERLSDVEENPHQEVIEGKKNRGSDTKDGRDPVGREQVLVSDIICVSGNTLDWCNRKVTGSKM